MSHGPSLMATLNHENAWDKKRIVHDCWGCKHHRVINSATTECLRDPWGTSLDGLIVRAWLHGKLGAHCPKFEGASP